jgi:hypothetical protein
LHWINEFCPNFAFALTQVARLCPLKPGAGTRHHVKREGFRWRRRPNRLGPPLNDTVGAALWVMHQLRCGFARVFGGAWRARLAKAVAEVRTGEESQTTSATVKASIPNPTREIGQDNAHRC